MLDPSLHPIVGAGASAFRGPRDFAGPLVGERMDHPAARLRACQTSVRSACPYTKLLAIGVSPGLSSAHGPVRVQTWPMKDAGERAAATGPLPPALAAALAAFERFLRSERSLSPHTVRAYASDIRSLLEYASRNGVDTPD